MFNYLDDNILNVYMFGSRVYGSNTESSDHDYIVVAKKPFTTDSTDIHVYTEDHFQTFLDRGEIQALECLCLPKQFVLKESVIFHPKFTTDSLRRSISMVASNSWVKAKKKITVLADYDLNAGLKSLFHSIRILDFGIQIASSGCITRWDTYNYVLADIKKMSEKLQYDTLWDAINTKYNPLFKKLSHEFKLLAPKDLALNSKDGDIKHVLKSFGVYSEELFTQLKNLL